MVRILSLACVLAAFSVTAQPSKTNFITGKTYGAMAYLEYGLGEDRLGGAKMTFLDSNIVVRVVDSIKDRYRIQLSKNHFAYLPKSNFRSDSTPVIVPPYYLSNSWKVYGDSAYDYVMIALDEKLPYRSIEQINPSRIIVDVFGVTSNTNWITQLSTVKEIRNSWYEQIEDDVFRVFIELKHDHWGYHIFYDNKKLVIQVKRQPAKLVLSNLKVAVDAGHGGDNTGATGVTSKIEEKKYTLLIAKELEKALKKEKAKVFMTRQIDTSLSMPERTQMLRAFDPNFLISIHLNSSGNDTIKGVSTYYRYIGFRPLSQFILKRMTELKLKEFGNVGSFNFSLSGPTEYPNCLVEVAFLSNKEDEKRILDPKFHKAVAAKIVAGIKDWLKSMK